MNKIIPLVLFVTVASVAGLPKPEPQWPFGRIPGRRIVGGEEAVPHEFPWIVDMRRGGHYCGGSVINEEWVVTAAHCSTASASNYVLVAGDHNIQTPDPNQQDRQVVRIIRHPLYESAGAAQYQYDIALMQVAPPFELNTFVQPITLPELGLESPSVLTVAGWGALQQGGGSPVVLHKVDVPYVDDFNCNQAYPGQITDDMICAGEAGKDSCQGDSGGPLTCDVNGTTYLCGIVSWGRGCAQPGYPGVYTETSFFTEWIASAIVPEPEDNSTFVEQNEGCGGSLAGSSGQVSYKLGQNFGSNEKCTWALRARDQTAIRVEVYDADLGAGNQLLVTELDNESGILSNTYTITAAGVYNFTGPIIFLTLQTGAEEDGNGFRLHFYGTGYSGATGFTLSHYFGGGASGSLSHPPSGGNYLPDELSTIVINSSEESSTLSIDRLDLESSTTCSFDRLNLHRFNSINSNFVLVGSYCGTTTPPAVQNNGPFILTFRSDFSVQQTGFSLSFY